MAKSPHWHDYRLVMIIESEVNPNNSGWAFDFDDLDSRMDGLLKSLDGADLNKIIDRPTSEMVACWCLAQLPEFVTAIRVAESDRSSAEVLRKDIKGPWMQYFRDHVPGTSFTEELQR